MQAHKLFAVGTAVLAVAAAAPVAALAKNGSDDPIVQVRNGADDPVGHQRNGKDDALRVRHLSSRHLARHARHGRGNDDGPNHR
jgi:hypothetical protein